MFIGLEGFFFDNTSQLACDLRSQMAKSFMRLDLFQ